MTDVTPRGFRIGTVVRATVLSNLEAGANAGNFDINEGIGIHDGLDGEGSVIFGEGDGNIVGVEGTLLLVEFRVGEGLGGPEVGSVWVEYFYVELRSNMEVSKR